MSCRWSSALAICAVGAVAATACGAADGDPAGDASDAAPAAGSADAATPPDGMADGVPTDAPGAGTRGPADAAPLPDAKSDAKSDAKPADSLDAVACKRACTGKVCGSDGCGAVCGFCKTGQSCQPDGKACTTVCVPACTGKQCGPNGCGGQCGGCLAAFHCADDQLCHPDDCKPQCGAKQCGDNGCGMACGTCGAGDVCGSDGMCSAGPCKGVPKEGECKGFILVQCQGESAAAQKVQVDCGAKPGKKCGWDAVAVPGAYACVDKGPCDPVCKDASGTEFECGDDGCGGTCGTCTAGWACTQGECIPKAGAACGSLPPTGLCQNDNWVFCNQNKVAILDCKEAGMACKFDGKKFGCQ